MWVCAHRQVGLLALVCGLGALSCRHSGKLEPSTGKLPRAQISPAGSLQPDSLKLTSQEGVATVFKRASVRHSDNVVKPIHPASMTAKTQKLAQDLGVEIAYLVEDGVFLSATQRRPMQEGCYSVAYEGVQEHFFLAQNIDAEVLTNFDAGRPVLLFSGELCLNAAGQPWQFVNNGASTLPYVGLANFVAVLSRFGVELAESEDKSLQLVPPAYRRSLSHVVTASREATTHGSVKADPSLPGGLERFSSEVDASAALAKSDLYAATDAQNQALDKALYKFSGNVVAFETEGFGKVFVGLTRKHRGILTKMFRPKHVDVVEAIQHDIGNLLVQELRRGDVDENAKYWGNRRADEVVEYTPASRRLVMRRLENWESAPIEGHLRSGQKYRIRSVIGEGSFGRVRKLEILEEDRVTATYAVKILKAQDEQLNLEAIERSILIGNNLDHPAFLKTLAYFSDVKGNMVLIQEYGGESLLGATNWSNSYVDYVDRGRQILEGMSHLQQKGYGHYDFKLENLLIHEGQIRIIDTDNLGRTKAALNQNTNPYSDELTMSFGYAGPERIARTLPYKRNSTLIKTDVYSVGISLLKMRLSKNVSHIYEEALVGQELKWEWMTSVPAEYSDGLDVFIQNLRNYPEGMQQFHAALPQYLAEHGLSKQEIALYTGMMEGNLRKRLSMTEALKKFNSIYPKDLSKIDPNTQVHELTPELL
ncbi:MAG: protein kinase [Zetaproteobacteria bacterium]|nr:protein kinase [Zetaproteobacteria bacterium]